MKFISSKLIVYICMIMFFFKKCAAMDKENKFPYFYYMKNQVLALREELQVDGLEIDSSFTGGYGVNRWIVLPSFSNTFLIGIKKRGLNLITISKKVGSLFQAVEKSLDLDKNITSAVAFNFLNDNSQRSEGIVVVSTDAPKYEVIWFKIQNYKLIKIWSWIRYSGTLSLHYFSVMREPRLLILDSSGITAHVYSFSFDSPTPSVRELEVLSFNQKVLSLALSVTLPEPYLYAWNENELEIYRYKRACSDSWVGNFVKQPIHFGMNMGITHIYPFSSEGREYLAIGGRDSALWRIDIHGTIVPEMELESIREWLIMRVGPQKERILLFGRSDYGDISVFSNVGLGWSHHPTPSCYRYSKQEQEKVETDKDLSCLSDRSWDGVASLEIGDLPTLIFSDRKFYGEMFHVMVKMRHDIIPLDLLPPTEGEYTNYLMRMKSSLEGLVSDMDLKKAPVSNCNIFNMLTTIENVASRAKQELNERCGQEFNLTNHVNYQENSSRWPITQNEVTEMNESNEFEEMFNGDDQNINDRFFGKGTIKEEGFNNDKTKIGPTKDSEDYAINMHPISPDLEVEPAAYEVPNDLSGTLQLAGYPKKQKIFGN